MQHEIAICLGVLVIPIFSCSIRFLCLDVVSNYWRRFNTKYYLVAYGIHNMVYSSIPFSQFLTIKHTKSTKHFGGHILNSKNRR